MAQVTTIVPLAARTTSGDSGGSMYTGGPGRAENVVMLVVTAISGATLTLLVEHSDDGTNWTTLDAFPAQTARTIGITRATSGEGTKPYTRVSWTITGGTVSFFVVTAPTAPQVFEAQLDELEAELGAVSLTSTKTVDLTSEQILTLHSAPVEAIPPPAANQMIYVTSAVFIMTPGATPYVTNTDMTLLYAGTTGPPVAGGSSILTSASPSIAWSDQSAAGGGTALATTAARGAAIVARVTDTDPTAGDGTLQVVIAYQVLDI